MAAVQCNNFVGNAWKKDLCLNCFKSKEEHLLKNGNLNPVPTRIPDAPKEGILKGSKPNSQTPKGNKVVFLNKEYEVIGFGGDDVYSEDEDYPDTSSNLPTEDDDLDTEEDRAFQKLTKTNTDFNSIPENLKEPKEGEVKKIIEPLKLGKQVFDEKGNKTTLLVSVTPFGDQTTFKNKINMNGFKINSFSSDKETKSNAQPNGDVDLAKKDLSEKNKFEKCVNGDDVKENSVKNKCVNEEVVEKKLKCEKAIEIAQISNEDASLKLANDKSLKRSQPLDKNLKVRLVKDSHKENEKLTELNGENCKSDKNKTSSKVNNVVDKTKNNLSVVEESQNCVIPTESTLSAKKVFENTKEVVLDIYKIQENGEVKNFKEINGEKEIKTALSSPETENKFSSPEKKIDVSSSCSPSDLTNEKNKKLENGTDVENNPMKSEITAKDKFEKVQNGSSMVRSKLVPNVSSLYRHHFKNSSVNKANEENKADSSDKPLSNGVISSMSFVPNNECLRWESNKRVDFTEKSVENITEEAKKVEGNSQSDLESPKDEKFKKTSFESFESFERIIKGEEITLFSANDTREINAKDEKSEQDKADIVPEISRESAGEPDGRADSDDLSEPPALPLKPPPPLTDSRSTFFHDLTAGGDVIKTFSEKPKVPAKPLIIQPKKSNFKSPIHSDHQKSPSVEKFLDASFSPQIKPHSPLQESLSSDSNKNHKRPAPKPPSPKEDLSERYIAMPVEVESDDSGPKQLEVEESIIKRISRSTENLLEFIAGQEDKEELNVEGIEEISVTEPVSRRSLSLSQDSLVPNEIGDVQTKKKPNRGRFFLRKLLHLGKPKETPKDSTIRQKTSLPPTPKVKLEIIHPSDLNGSRVEVVPPARTSKSRRTSSSASSSSGEQRESDVLSDSSTSHSVSSSGNDFMSTIEKSKKPPPPPRSHSYDTWSVKPARPPPPKSIDILRQVNSSWTTSIASKPDSLYVNLGEARSGLAPNKPVRTGSLREGNMESAKRVAAVVTQPEDSDYESFVVTSGQQTTPPQSDDNLYECVQVLPHRSSLPECDSAPTNSSNSSFTKEKRTANSRNSSHRHSEGNVELNSDYFKIKFMRSVSLPYCASETESEIYSPYSFYGSEMGDEDFDASSTSSHTLRMSRLKLKKGRSIVHKNLEDNYGAVIVANHEALAQVVEQMRLGPTPPLALRALSTVGNLRWSSFTILKDAAGVVVERRVFYPALWGSHPVTLSVTAEQGLNSFHAKGPFNLNPLAELNDLVPVSFLPMLQKDGSELIQASISVLTRLQIETVESYGKNLNTGFLSDETKKEVNFVLLQIINAFKTLQAQGIEEAPRNLTNLIVCREEKDLHPRVCIVHSFERSQEETPKTTLCQCAIHAIKDILPSTDLTPLISNLLRQEKAVSLSQAKGILEFSLWGPADIAFGNSSRERESALQRWLDLERATVLHGLVRTRAELTVFEEWQLLFLVRTNAKMMAEASLLLESGSSEDVSSA